MRSEYKMHTEDLEEPSVDDLPQMLSSETVDCLLWCFLENERLFLCSMTRSACYLAARMTTAYMRAYACVTQMFAVQKKGMLLWMVFAHAIGVNKFWFLVYSYLSNCIVCFT